MFLIGFLGFIDVFQGTDGSNVKIYFAGPLFTEAERSWIRSTIRKIEALAIDQGIKVEIVFPV